MNLFEHAEQRAQEEMARAARHAEAEHKGWADEAYSFLLSFAREHHFFISEDVSDASHGRLRQPNTKKAWGQLYRRAAKDGIIVQDGTGRSRLRHASICVRWRSMIYQGGGKDG